jgi:hypothetical protein
MYWLRFWRQQRDVSMISRVLTAALVVLAFVVLLWGPKGPQHWDANMSPQERAVFEKTVWALGH